MAGLPETYRKLVVKTFCTDFAKATEIVRAQLPKPKPNEVLIKNKYLGINACDIMITGKYESIYLPIKDFFPEKTPGLVPGIECLGEVVGIGSDVKNFNIGQPVAYMGFLAYAEYVVGYIKQGDKVLITAAAGGTGHIAVQHAKLKGCQVLGLCSSEEKVAFLKEYGCDRVINYKKEKLDEVLQKEYPEGIDVIWETIGGNIFTQCLDNLAFKGRMVILGSITNYKSDAVYKSPPALKRLPEKIKSISASVEGFRLCHYGNDHASYHAYLLDSYKEKKIKVKLDNGEKLPNGVFKGLESVSRAVEYLCSGKSIGKIYVEI